MVQEGAWTEQIKVSMVQEGAWTAKKIEAFGVQTEIHARTSGRDNKTKQGCVHAWVCAYIYVNIRTNLRRGQQDEARVCKCFVHA